MDPAIPSDAISRADIQRRTERIESLLRSMDGLIGAMGRILDTRLQGVLEKLPSLSESDLKELGDFESDCPICYVPFRAILAAEELSSAMESPASAMEELGVTRLTDTCGHIFCRKDLTKWIQEHHNTCPLCRQCLIAHANNHETALGNASSREALESLPPLVPGGSSIVDILADVQRVIQSQNSSMEQATARLRESTADDARASALEDAEGIAEAIRTALATTFERVAGDSEDSSDASEARYTAGSEQFDHDGEDRQNDREGYVGMYS